MRPRISIRGFVRPSVRPLPFMKNHRKGPNTSEKHCGCILNYNGPIYLPARACFKHTSQATSLILTVSKIVERNFDISSNFPILDSPIFKIMKILFFFFSSHPSVGLSVGPSNRHARVDFPKYKIFGLK